MKKFEGLLFCSDLDGTLYTSDKTVSKENLEAIEYFKSEGGLFTFITGRVPLTCGKIYNLIKPNAPYGCVNGCGIYDGCEKGFLWQRFLSDSVFELISEVDKRLPDIGIQASGGNAVYFFKDNYAMERFRAAVGLECGLSSYSEIKEPIMKIVFAHHKEEQLSALSRLLAVHPRASEFDFIRSAKILYEILPKNVSKGKLLSKMAELLGIDIRKTIAIGDFNNDISMIRTAGLGVAVSNAVDEVKEAADLITVSNNESAIAKVINGIDSGEYKL